MVVGGKIEPRPISCESRLGRELSRPEAATPTPPKLAALYACFGELSMAYRTLGEAGGSRGKPGTLRSGENGVHSPYPHPGDDDMQRSLRTLGC